MKQRFTKLLAAVALLVFMTPSLAGWGQTTIYSETFGDNGGNNTAYALYEGYSATMDMFVGTGTVTSHYSGSGKVGKNSVSPSDYTGASGLSAAWYTGSKNSTADALIISGISIEGYEDLNLSFGINMTNGASTTNTTTVSYKIDNGDFQTLSFVHPTTSGWGVKSGSINGTGTSLTIKFTMATVGGYTTRYDDIIVTGTSSGGSSVVSTTTTIDASGITNTDVYINTAAGTLTATVTENTNNTTISGATVTWTSSNESVATIASDGTVTLVAAGTTNITASYAGVENQYAPSTSEPYVLTVTNSAPYVQPNSVVINMNYQWLGSGNGSNLNSNQLPVIKTDDNVTTTITDGTSTRPRGDADYIRIYTGSTLTFDAPEGYVITNIVFTTGGTGTWNAPSVSSGELSGKAWTGQEESVVFSLTGTCFISKVTISLVDATNIVATTTTIDATGITNTDLYINTAAGSLSATVSANNQPIADATVTWSGDDDDVATIDANTGVVTLVGTGSVTFTARYAGVPGQYLSSSNTYEMTVTSSAPDYVTLPFNWAGGTSAGLTNLTGVSGNSLGDYADANAPYRVQFNATGDYILIKTNQQPAVVSVGIKKVGGAGASSITIQGSANGTDFTDIDTFDNEGNQNAILTHVTTHDFAASDRYVRIYFNKPSSGGANVGVGPITIRGIESFELTIAGYTNGGGWNLIASPIVNVDPVSAGMITDEFVSTNVTPDNGTYDLYRFNQSADLEWENYRAHSFALESGKGYLYASKEGVSIQFVGTPYNSNGEIPLVYDEGKDFAGWNLVGNPFANATTFTTSDTETGDVPELNFLTMNENGNGFITTTSSSFNAAAFQGFFVQATGNTQQLQVEESGGLKTANLNIAVSHNHGNLIDNAIVNFGNASMMKKFYLSNNTTRVYIPQDNREMAVVHSTTEAEMPVNFKASENGTYTLAVEAENVEMNYLHLIDNMTGMDVDLLQTPSYTFDATTNDYTSRFRLVFSANDVNEQNAETFAFFSNGNWVVNNEGEATLQVIDVNGRIVSNETINGSVATSINATPGVYMLRLVNGNEVKTQKIVVR